MRPPKKEQPFLLHQLFWWAPNREDYGILNAYALKNNLGPHTPFPSDILRVEGVPFTETFVDFYENYIQKLHVHGNWSYQTHRCENGLSPEDMVSVERVLQDDSEDKHILFMGFDASCPTEGGNIFFDTPQYRHSLFWSDFKQGIIPEHNRIRTCFCQSQALLDSGLQNYFDYIIIGGQTVEYLNAETWGKLRHFLKEGGYIVYPEMVWFYWGGEIINHLLNTFDDMPFEFKLHRCDDPRKDVFYEIRNLAQFNNEPSHGEFCYGGPNPTYTLCLHKKMARPHKKLDCHLRNL